MSQHSALLVPSRFRGPAQSGNGGWTAGALAALIPRCPTDHAMPWPTVEVTLRRPPPLDVEIAVETTDDEARCEVGEARIVERELAEAGCVPAAEARAAETAYAGLVSHPFPDCFGCGPNRAEGDGLRIFPGPVGAGRVAGTWTPHPSMGEDWHEYAGSTPRVSLPVTWAALDCVGGWASGLDERPMVLGRMTARVHRLPAIATTYVLVGRLLGTEGPKTFTAASLWDPDGDLVGTAEHTWIEVDPASFGR